MDRCIPIACPRYSTLRCVQTRQARFPAPWRQPRFELSGSARHHHAHGERLPAAPPGLGPAHRSRCAGHGRVARRPADEPIPPGCPGRRRNRPAHGGRGSTILGRRHAASPAECGRQPPLRLRQQHHPAVRGDAPAVESGSHFLAVHRWKRERQHLIVCHGGCGTPALGKDCVSTTKSYAVSAPYATSASPSPRLGE